MKIRKSKENDAEKPNLIFNFTKMNKILYFCVSKKSENGLILPKKSEIGLFSKKSENGLIFPQKV